MNLNFLNCDFPVLELNNKYYLRELDINDTKSYFSYIQNIEVNKYILSLLHKIFMKLN